MRLCSSVRFGIWNSISHYKKSSEVAEVGFSAIENSDTLYMQYTMNTGTQYRIRFLADGTVQRQKKTTSDTSWINV